MGLEYKDRSNIYNDTDHVSSAVTAVVKRSLDRWSKEHYNVWPNMEDGEPKGWRTDYTRFCKHGTNIGHPYGPDLMCGPCEDGMSNREYELRVAVEYLDDMVNEYQLLVQDLVMHLPRGAFDNARIKRDTAVSIMEGE